jgi:hypothetical protein
VISAVVALLRALERAGARHPDLNLGNVLMIGDSLKALVLDVDRIVFQSPGSQVGEANLTRLLRSALKLRGLGRIEITDQELTTLAQSAEYRQ